MTMICPRCGQPLLSVLEQTRRICAACHLFPESAGMRQASDPAASVPPPAQSGRAAGAETTAGDPEAPDPASPAGGTAPALGGQDIGGPSD